MLCYPHIFLVVQDEERRFPNKTPDCCTDKPTQLDTVTKSVLAELTDSSHRSSGHWLPATCVCFLRKLPCLSYMQEQKIKLHSTILLSVCWLTSVESDLPLAFVQSELHRFGVARALLSLSLPLNSRMCI